MPIHTASERQKRRKSVSDLFRGVKKTFRRDLAVAKKVAPKFIPGAGLAKVGKVGVKAVRRQRKAIEQESPTRTIKREVSRGITRRTPLRVAQQSVRRVGSLKLRKRKKSASNLLSSFPRNRKQLKRNIKELPQSVSVLFGRRKRFKPSDQSVKRVDIRKRIKAQPKKRRLEADVLQDVQKLERRRKRLQALRRQFDN